MSHGPGQLFHARIAAGIVLGLLALPLGAIGGTSDNSRAAERSALSIAPPAGGDGTWELLLSTPPFTYRHAAVYDPVRDRLLVTGFEVWSLTLAETPTWSRIDPAGAPPPIWSNHTAVYDPVRDRVLVFGGEVGATLQNAVWVLNLAGTPTWSQLNPIGSRPSPRTGHSAIYDPLRDRMLVFGGSDGALRHDTWALALAGSAEWSELHPAGTPPGGRSEHAAIYDPAGDRMVVFGGYDGSDRNDTWTLGLGMEPSWAPADPSGSPPSPRIDHAAIHDPVRNRMLVFGGLDNDVWALALGELPAWNVLEPAGSRPDARSGPNAIHDPVRDQMIVYGGFDLHLRNDVWSLALGGPMWSPLGPAGNPPGRRAEHSAIRDAARDRMLIFGGILSFPDYFADTWALPLASNATWTPLMPAGPLAPARSGHTAIYDPARDRMLVFGGSQPHLYGDVWALALAGNPDWSQIVPLGFPPPELSEPVALFDLIRDRMILVGQDPGQEGPPFTEVWSLSLAGTPAWSRLSAAGASPPGRTGHTAIYDPARDRVVIFGGMGAAIYNDVWALSLAEVPVWSRLEPAGLPPSPRQGHTAIYDPIRDRMVVFGGTDSDVWTLSLGEMPAWSRLSPTGTQPGGYHGHSAVYDPVHDRMVTFGGRPGGNSVWALTWGEAPVSTVVALVDAEVRSDRIVLTWYGPGAHGLVAALERRDDATDWSERAIVTADGTGTFRHEDRDILPGMRYAYRLAYRSGEELVHTAAVWVAMPRLAFAMCLQSNPARGRFVITLSLPDAGPAQVEIFDLAGRRVFARSVSGPGEQSLTLGGTGKLRPGVYTIRLTDESHSTQVRGVLLR